MLIGALALAALLAPPADPWPALAVDLLSRYLRVDTTVPPGNELRGARFYAEVLEAEGIPVRIDEFAPGRANLLAVLPGSGAKRPLVLSNHMDVVPADASRWTQPPFSGLVKDGVIWGRGAIDMKAEGILQLLAVLRLHREQVPLDRDVIFLATADEEADFLGVERALSPAGFGAVLRRAEFLINEGGENRMREDGRPALFAVETGEKGPFWLKLKTTGTPGHGSRPLPDSALNRLVRALERIRLHETALTVVPTVRRSLRDEAAFVPEPLATWYRDVDAALRDPAGRAALVADKDANAVLRNTISITVVKAGYKTNVIPGTAEAELDVRLLPGSDPAAFLAELRGVIDDPSVEIVPPSDFRTPNASPPEGELVRAVEAVLARHHPGVPVTTRMLAGGTESVLFRELGIQSYGFTPLLLTAAELDSQHADDERIREKALRDAVRPFYDVVVELCGRK